MQINVNRGDQGRRSLVIDGEMTIYGAAEAKDVLLAALYDSEELVIDLSQVVEMDTAGLQIVVLLWREAIAAGKRVSLTGQSPAVREVFDSYRIAPYLGATAVTHGGQR